MARAAFVLSFRRTLLGALRLRKPGVRRVFLDVRFGLHRWALEITALSVDALTGTCVVRIGGRRPEAFGWEALEPAPAGKWCRSVKLICPVCDGRVWALRWSAAMSWACPPCRHRIDQDVPLLALHERILSPAQLRRLRTVVSGVSQRVGWGERQRDVDRQRTEVARAESRERYLRVREAVAGREAEVIGAMLRGYRGDEVVVSSVG